jgi:hypothetical protein
MAFKIDPSQYEVIEEAPAPAVTGSIKLDPQQFEELPDYTNGLDPSSPINKSPVSEEDRAILTTGNGKGKVNYLRKKFEDVTEDEHGDLLVKDKGLWHRVDPNQLGDVDPWEATKKIAGTLLKNNPVTFLANLHPATAESIKEKLKDVPSYTLDDVKEQVSEARKDVADLYDVALVGGAAAAGAAVGTATATPGLGSIAGAAAGGMAGEAYRTSLGACTAPTTPPPKSKLRISAGKVCSTWVAKCSPSVLVQAGTW